MDWLLAKLQVFGVAFWQTARQMSFGLLWGFILAGVLSLAFVLRGGGSCAFGAFRLSCEC